MLVTTRDDGGRWTRGLTLFEDEDLEWNRARQRSEGKKERGRVKKSEKIRKCSMQVTGIEGRVGFHLLTETQPVKQATFPYRRRGTPKLPPPPPPLSEQRLAGGNETFFNLSLQYSWTFCSQLLALLCAADSHVFLLCSLEAPGEPI